MSNHLKQITARAKQLRRAHPSMKWIVAIKTASAEYRGGKRSAPKKKATVRKKAAPKKRRAHKAIAGPTVRRKVSGESISGLKSKLKDHYKNQLGKELVKRDLSTKKREKSKLTKKITEIRNHLKKLM
jgi:uncharacterized protein YeeX (DUF496 family)